MASLDLRGVRGLPGAHNHQNACAAYGALRTLGLAPKLIEQGFASFEGLAHRSQIVAERDGVTFVNDSKATNADSASMALSAFKRVRWIVGGQMKDGGLGAVEPHLAHVVKAYVIGRQAAEVALELGAMAENLACDISETMEVAVARAAADACEGETVLLAPAAASFDQFDNFEKRGDAFVDAVKNAIG